MVVVASEKKLVGSKNKNKLIRKNWIFCNQSICLSLYFRLKIWTKIDRNIYSLAVSLTLIMSESQISSLVSSFFLFPFLFFLFFRLTKNSPTICLCREESNNHT